MKVLEGSYFQKGPPPLIPRNSNPLSEIRELFATGLYRDKYRNLAVKNFQIWSLTLDSIQSSTNGHTNQYTPTAIWKLNLLKVITVTSEKPYYNYLRHCCVDFEQINTCWENATYFFITPIKQALVVHWILYSTQPIAHNLSY